MKKSSFYFLITALAMAIAFTLAYRVNAKEIGTGTVTAMEGSAQIFANPSPKWKKLPPPRVYFKGRYYTLRKVKIGDRVDKGNIIRTLPNGKVRVVHENGDQMRIGPSTSIEVFVTGKKNDRLNLNYGKIRNMIAKKKKARSFRIRSKGATIGVRGTDFFVEASNQSDETRLAVIRGEVVFRAASQAKEESVKSGRFISTREKIRPIRQAELRRVSKISHIQSPQTSELSPSIKEKVKKLEEKATETSLNDIKAEDPESYSKIMEMKKRSPASENDSISSVDQLFLEEFSKKLPEGDHYSSDRYFENQ